MERRVCHDHQEQWGKMGLSVDYSRERFTLDEGLSKAVRKGLCGPLQKRLDLPW